MEAADINVVGIFEKLSQPCDGVGKHFWDGITLSDAAHNLIMLLGASRTPEIPAFLFLRPLVQRRRWTESGEIQIVGCKLSSFARLCLRVPELSTPASKEPEDGLTLPKDIFAWFCCSSFDINSDQDSTDLGDELRRLLSAGVFVVHVKEGLVYLSLSEHLRDSLFQLPIKSLQEARLRLVGLIILSLAEPYTETLWEMVLLHSRNILKSTVIPYLLLADTRELRHLSHMIEPAGNSRFNSALMTLPFQLVSLGLTIDLINWKALLNNSSPLCTTILQSLGALFDHSDAGIELDEILGQTHWLQTSSFPWSLIGFTVALKRRHSTDVDVPWWYEKTSNKWLASGPPGSSTMGRVARSLVFPETIQSGTLTDQLGLSTQASLGVSLNALGFPEHGCPLLDQFLTTTASCESYLFRPTDSVPYGLLSAELLNYRNSAHKGRDLRLWGLGLVSSRDISQLGNRFDSISIKLAVADIHISVADYATAQNLLKQVLLSGNLDAYTQIVTNLRSNKVGRRTGRFSSRFGDSLGRVVPLTAKADTEVQREFVAELAATVTHLKRLEPTSPYHSDLDVVVQQTIDLYDQHTILQDDWRLQMMRTASVKTSQGVSNLTPLCKASIGPQAAYSLRSPPSIVSPDASFITSSAASVVITNNHGTPATTWCEPSVKTASVSQEALALTVKAAKSSQRRAGKRKRGFGNQQAFIKKFACLFFKLDSRKYACCAGYTITSWDRLLQHLKRLHLIEGDYCPKCREELVGEFAEDDKNEHIRQDTCIEKTALETGLLLRGEYDDLSGLYGSHEEKWYKAWEKLFGEHPAPYSPFVEFLDSMLDAQYNTLTRELPSLLLSFRHDAMVKAKSDPTADTINAVLRLVRNPISTSDSLVRTERQNELSPPTRGPSLGSSPRVHQMPFSRVPEPPQAIKVDPLGPSPNTIYPEPNIHTMKERSIYESLWQQSFQKLSIDNEELHQLINLSGD